MTNTVPAVDTAKIPRGSSGVSSDQIATTTELPAASDGTGAFRTACQFSHMAFDDPIVYPGQPGRSHLHVFFGNTGTNANSTADSIANTGNSTCLGGTINRTAYWAPAMIDTKDGTPVVPAMAAIYYKTGYTGVAPATVQPMPDGLRMIAGTSSAKAPVQWGPATFACIDAATGNGATVYALPTNCAVGNTIWVRVVFPQCWDGVNLDSPDHKSHMAYPSGGCPASHPVAIPEITVNVLYPVTDASAPARWRLASDNYDPTLPAGYSSHADWFNGWKSEFVDSFVQGCERPAKDCHAHLLGNGERML
jgi:hypothetical protein